MSQESGEGGPSRGSRRGGRPPVDVQVTSRQRRHRVDRSRIAEVARRTHDVAGGPGGVISILLTSDRRVQDLNRRFRGVDRATDVLSFPDREVGPDGGRHLGDVAISVEAADRQAEASGRERDWILDRLVAHGVLHLLGWDHETDDGEMMALQGRILRQRPRPEPEVGP